MPPPRQGRRTWPLWSGLIATIVVAVGSCVVDDRPQSPAGLPASSAARAIARAERSARARALEEQDPAPPARATSKPAAPPPTPPPPPEPEPEPTDAGTPDAEPVDGGADAATLASDAGAPPADASAPDPATLCERVCDKVIACMRTLVGDVPPGLDEQRMADKLRKECIAECSKEVNDHIDEAEVCLDEEDCSAFLECIKSVEDD